MLTKTRPLARFGYLAFDPSLIFSRNNCTIGYRRREAPDLEHKSAVQVRPVTIIPSLQTIGVAMGSPQCQNRTLVLY